MILFIEDGLVAPSSVLRASLVSSPRSFAIVCRSPACSDHRASTLRSHSLTSNRVSSKHPRVTKFPICQSPDGKSIEQMSVIFISRNFSPISKLFITSYEIQKLQLFPLKPQSLVFKGRRKKRENNSFRLSHPTMSPPRKSRNL